MKISSAPVWKLISILVILVLGLTLLWAQPSKKEKPSKLVLGVVVDQEDQPLATAVVSLTNLQTKKISQDITDDKGEFRFGGVNPDNNYELQAFYHSYVGQKEQISMYDTRPKREFYFKLPVKLADASQEIDTGFSVTDEQGRGVPGASLKFTASKRIQTLTATTDSSGKTHQWLSLVDTYSIVIEAKGYETQVREAFKPSREIGGLQIPLKAAK